MTNNESINEYWNSEFTSSDKLFFQKCARILLKKTFIVRDKDVENRKMFYFVSKVCILCLKWYKINILD